MIASRKPPQPAAPVVYIVDDDTSMQESLVDLFRSMSIEAVAFGNTAAFLDAARPGAGCILLDVRLPDLNGLELQEHLNAKGNKMPIIFMTGYGDIPMTVKAMKAGGVACERWPRGALFFVPSAAPFTYIRLSFERTDEAVF